MFDWAAHTKRGMLIFIDEAVSAQRRRCAYNAADRSAYPCRMRSCPSAAAWPLTRCVLHLSFNLADQDLT